MNTRLLLLTLAVAALVLGSQLVKAQDDCGDYNNECYGLEPYGSPYSTSNHYNNDRPLDTYEIMSENYERQREMRRDTNRQLQNLNEESRQNAIMRELRQINEALRQ